jgi:MoxR-like ATPase
MKQILNRHGFALPGQTPALPSLRARLKASQDALRQYQRMTENLLVVEASLRWKLGITHAEVPAIVNAFIAETKANLKTPVVIPRAEKPVAAELPADA